MLEHMMGRVAFAPNPPGVERPHGAYVLPTLTEADVRRIVAEELAKLLPARPAADDIEGAPV